MTIKRLNRVNSAACLTKRTVDLSGKLKRAKSAYAVLALCAMTAAALPAQTFTTLHSFDGTDGAAPIALVQATDGNLYGTTSGTVDIAGSTSFGSVFNMTPSGTPATLYRFCKGCEEGIYPVAGLVQATNGDFYGTTGSGGTHREGALFEITPSGTPTLLYDFCPQSGCKPGFYSEAVLIQAANGDLYGTTDYGGPNNGGAVFKVSPSGKVSAVYDFCSLSECADGAQPRAGVVQAGNGDFNGTTYYGGANVNCPEGHETVGCSTIFKITAGGKLTTLYNFCSQSGCADGGLPSVLVQGTDGYFYGRTAYGGANNYGTVFKITADGTLTTLYSFCSQTACADGEGPGAFIQATDGNFYGTTAYGGTNDTCSILGQQSTCGTMFKITPTGTLTTLYNFCSQGGKSCTDGDFPAGLMQATNGEFYGTTAEGGDNACHGVPGCGTIFTLSVGLGPFVETQPTSGKVGAAVNILGTDLTGVTSVTFNGTAAAFEVVSSSEITTTVPVGASSGTVQVVTTGTLSSNVPFRVLP
jgi:uncharacterized repeat protein (TIGR03803 family)